MGGGVELLAPPSTSCEQPFSLWEKHYENLSDEWRNSCAETTISNRSMFPEHFLRRVSYRYEK